MLIFWLILSGLVGWFASTKGRSGFGFFILSLLISPILVFIVALLVKDQTSPQPKLTNENSKICPQCAESVRSQAKICRFCKYSFNDEPAISKSTATTFNNNSVSPSKVVNDNVESAKRENNVLVPALMFLVIIAGICAAAYYIDNSPTGEKIVAGDTHIKQAEMFLDECVKGEWRSSNNDCYASAKRVYGVEL